VTRAAWGISGVWSSRRCQVQLTRRLFTDERPGAAPEW
jgi:hypothetical protein